MMKDLVRRDDTGGPLWPFTLAVPPAIPAAFIALYNDTAYGNPFASDRRFGSYTG